MPANVNKILQLHKINMRKLSDVAKMYLRLLSSRSFLPIKNILTNIARFNCMIYT
jgi:hypothetical protein